MNHKTLRVGLIGVGAQSRENILPALLQMPAVEVVAACDTVHHRAETVRQFARAAEVFTDADQMIDTMALDAVVVACPPAVHRDVSHYAIKAGVNVFVEKPPCFTLEELQQLVSVACEHEVVTGVGLNFRFARPIRQIQTIAMGPPFGKTMHVQINHYANKPRSPLWGMESSLRSFLLAQAIHSIDLACGFGGGEIESVSPVIQKSGDAVLVQIGVQFRTGMSAQVLCGTIFPYFEFEIKVIGSESVMVTLDNLWNITLHEMGHATAVTGNDKRWRGRWQPGPLDSGYERSGYLGELAGFFESIRSGARFDADFQSLLPTYQVIEQVCDAERRSTGPAADRCAGSEPALIN